MKLFLKGVLLYSTLFLALFYLASADFLLEKEILLISTITLAGLFFLCYLLINKEDMDKLFFRNWFE